MRVFLATPSDPEWAQSARRLVERLRPASPPASWTRPESWHLTLKFLGEVSAETAERFARGLDATIARARGGALPTAGALLLPGRSRPRVLGVGFSAESSAAAQLSAIAGEAEEVSRRLGAPAVDRAFRPHVTLCRLRSPWPRDAVDRYAREADGWDFPDWPVRSCVLYESRLSPSGARHTPLADWTLAPEGAAVGA